MQLHFPLLVWSLTVSNHLLTDCHTFGDSSAFCQRSDGDRFAIGQQMIKDWSVTGRQLDGDCYFINCKTNEVFVKNQTISVQVAIMILYKIKLFRLQQIRMLQLEL